MKTTVIALVALTILSTFSSTAGNSSNASAIAHLDPKQILLQCHAPDGPGPIGVMREITHSNGKDYDWDVWDEITEQIMQGNTDWIKVSGCLAHGARYGGCASCNTFLQIAWAHALTTHPHAVLELRKWTSIDDACRLPFIEEDEAFLAQYMAQTLDALQALATTPEDYTDVVQDARRSCTWLLKASYLDPNRCKFNGDRYVCPEVKQDCRFNGDTYDCESSAIMP